MILLIMIHTNMAKDNFIISVLQWSLLSNQMIADGPHFLHYESMSIVCSSNMKNITTEKIIID